MDRIDEVDEQRMTNAERRGSKERVSRAVVAIANLNIREFREVLAVIDVRYLSAI